MPESTTDGTLEAVDRYLNAISGRDYDGMVASMTEDCVSEDTDPRPNGTRFVGNETIAKYFMGMGPDDVFEIKEKFASRDRCAVLWNYHWLRNGMRGNNRGTDTLRIRGGKVSENWPTQRTVSLC